MKARKIYWSRKAGKIIAEGKRNNKTIYLFQLPDIETVAKSLLFTKEKQDKIMEKISRLDYNDKGTDNQEAELPTTNIVRSIEKDDFDDTDPDDIMADVLASSKPKSI